MRCRFWTWTEMLYRSLYRPRICVQVHEQVERFRSVGD